MVKRGWALAYRKYSKKYVKDEAIAKLNNAGMWAGKFIAPWKWRRIKNKKEDVDTNQTQKTELELLEERDEDSLTEEEEDRMYELRRLRAQKRINYEVREEEQAEFKKADEEIAHLKTLLKPKKKKLPKGYVE